MASFAYNSFGMTLVITWFRFGAKAAYQFRQKILVVTKMNSTLPSEAFSPTLDSSLPRSLHRRVSAFDHSSVLSLSATADRPVRNRSRSHGLRLQLFHKAEMHVLAELLARPPNQRARARLRKIISFVPIFLLFNQSRPYQCSDPRWPAEVNPCGRP